MNPDPLFDALHRDIRTYHHIIQNRLIRRVRYDIMRYDAIDTYLETKKRALHRAARMSISKLDDTAEMAVMRARLELDAVYEDVVRDVQLIQKDIRELAEDNRRALESLKYMKCFDEREKRPEYLDSFDIFRS